MEGQDTVTEYERSIFEKLVAAYTINAVLVPMFVGALQSVLATRSLPIDQSWYEEGGVITQATTLGW